MAGDREEKFSPVELVHLPPCFWKTRQLLLKHMDPGALDKTWIHHPERIWSYFTHNTGQYSSWAKPMWNDFGWA